MKSILEDKKTLLHVLLILAAVLITYTNSLQNTFISDDLDLVARNLYIRKWSNLPKLFTVGYWESAGSTGGLYRPLTISSFLAEYSIAGPNPLIYHMDNVALHTLCSVLVYLIMGTLTKDGKAPLFAALLFAVHPVHVEAVSWVSGRAELLGAFFSLVSALIFIKRPSGARYVFLSCLFFLLALLSKESAAAMPILLGAYLLLFDEPGIGQGRFKNLALRLYPFLVTFLIYLGPRYFALGGALGPSGKERAFINIKPYYILLTMCQAFYEYIRLGFLPFNLNLVYNFPPPSSFFELKVLFPITAIALALLCADRITKFSKPVFYGILWFFIALLPVSNLIPIGMIMSERAMYIPSAGVCIVLGVALSRAGSMPCGQPACRFPFATVMLVGIMAFFAAGAINRNMVWKDGESFWTHTLKKSPGNAEARKGLGNFLLNRGQVDGAIEQFQAGLRLTPGYPGLHVNLGAAYMAKGMTDKAIEEYGLALKYDPDSESAHFNLGNAFLAKGLKDEAVSHLQTAIGLRPDDADAHISLGAIYAREGLTDKSLVEFETAVRLNPDADDAHNDLGIICANKGLKDKAVEHFEAAVRLKPDNPAYRNNLDFARAMK